MATVASHSCPNCGGELAIPKVHERRFRCEFCGSALQDDAYDDRSASDVRLTIATGSVLDLSNLQSYAGPAVSAVRRGVGISVAVVVALVIGGAALALVAFSSTSSTSTSTAGGNTAPVGVGDDTDATGLDVYNFSTSAIVGSDSESGPDLVTVANSADGFGLYYLDFDGTEDSGPLRWSAPLTAESVSSFDRVVAGPSFLYTNVGATVVAHNRRTGAEAFTIRLSDVIQHSICVDCLRLFGSARDTLVTLTADGQLSGWNAGDGSPRWSVRLGIASRQIIDFGGNPAVVDQVAGSDASVRVFEVATGSLLTEVRPECPDPTFGGTDPIGIYDQLTPVSATTFVWVSTSPIAGCAQRWDAGSPAATWTTPLPDGGSNIPYDDDNFVVSPTAVHVVQGDTVATFALDGGALTTATVLDTDLVGLAADDTTIVVGAMATRGSSSWTIQAIDAASGAPRWSFSPEADYLEPSRRLFVTAAGWLTHLGPDGLVVLQYREQDSSVVMQTIPLGSGTATASQTVDVASGEVIDRPSFFGFVDAVAYLAAGTQIVGVDTTTASVVATGP